MTRWVASRARTRRRCGVARRRAHPSRRRSAAARSSSGWRWSLPASTRCRAAAGFLFVHIEEVLEACVRDRSRSRARPSLVSHVELHEEAAVHAHVPHPPRGALERRGPGHRAGLRLHATRAFRKYLPDDPETPRDVAASVSLDAKTVRVVLRSRFAGWRHLFWIVLPRHALAGQDLENVWTDRIDNPKTGKPIGSGPFLVERWERGRQLTLVRNPRYWGPHTAYLDRLVLRFGLVGCAEATTAVELLAERRARHLPGQARPRARAWLPDDPRRRAPLRATDRAGSTSRSGSAQAATRRSGTSSCAARLRTASTGRRSCGRSSGSSFRRCDPPTAPSSCPEARTTGRTGAGTATAPPRRAACSSRRAAGEAATASTSALGSDSRSASVPAPAHLAGGWPSSSPSDSCGRRASRSTSAIAPGAALRADVGERRLRCPALHLVLRARSGLAEATSSAAAAGATTPATASGSSRATSTRPT